MSQPPKTAYLWLFWPDGPSKMAENRKILILWYPYFINLTQSNQFAFIHYSPKIKADWVTTLFRPPDNAFSKWDHGGKVCYPQSYISLYAVAEEDFSRVWCLYFLSYLMQRVRLGRSLSSLTFDLCLMIWVGVPGISNTVSILHSSNGHWDTSSTTSKRLDDMVMGTMWLGWK